MENGKIIIELKDGMVYMDIKGLGSHEGMMGLLSECYLQEAKNFVKVHRCDDILCHNRQMHKDISEYIEEVVGEHKKIHQ